MEQRTYTFIKNKRGSLSFPLESYNMQLPTKTFSIPHNANSVVVPFPYALGLFISQDALTQMDLGYFTVADFEQLKQAAVEIGLYPSENTPEVVSLKEIESKILKGDVAAVKDIINKKSKLYMDNIIAIARDNYGSLSNSMIRVIEDACGAELGIDE